MTTPPTMPLTSIIKPIWEGLLDLVYPQRCLVCDRDMEPLICEDCFESFTPVPEPACAICGRPVDSIGEDCRFCAGATAAGRTWAFQAARAASIYEGPLRQAIHRLKYNRIEALGEPLGAHLANRCIVDGLFSDKQWKSIGLVVPMPMHPQRRRRRGFNQSELLAAPIAEMLGVPLQENVIFREQRTPPQVGLSPEARRANLSAQAFRVPDPAAVAGKTVLLVDDVFTTGTTANACAAALRASGATAVYVATLAAGG